MRFHAVALLPSIICLAGEVREEVLVVVNNHVITRRQFQQAVEQATAALYRQFSGKVLDEKLRDARDKVLSGMIDAFLLEDKAADLGVGITDEQIRSYIEEVKRQNNFASDADFEKALRGQLNIGISDYMKRLRQSEMQNIVLNREVRSKIAIEDQELRAFYEDHKDEYKQPSRFRIRELVLSKGVTSEEQTQARERLAAIQKALKDGQSFEALAKEHSISPSKSTGGDLGWMAKGLLRGAIEKAALALAPNQVSEPVETDKDLMLIQLIAAEDNVVKAFEDVKPQILEKLQEPKSENAIQNYLSNLRTRANIRFLVSKDQILKG